MANILASHICTVVLIIIIITTTTTTTTTTKAAGEEDYVISSRGGYRPASPDKLTHFRLYWQNDASQSPNATDVNIIPPASNTSAFYFGMVDAIDDPLTVGPGLNSTTVARAQGIYACNSQHELAKWMVINLAFLWGKYNGSALTVAGRNLSLTKLRELSIVGGSGVFRMARGYVLLTTYFFDAVAGIAVVEYNIYVEHY